MSQEHVYRVLVVDDDPMFARLLEKHLVDTGHQVLTAADGFQAMRILLDQGADIIITDWMMPGMNGIELCQAIRAQEGVGFVYVIILTAQTDNELTVAAFEAGADDFLRKPFNRQELLARLRAGKRVIALQCDLDRRNREVHLVNAKMALAAREVEAANARLRLLATTDELTGLLNRREAMNRMQQAWAASERHTDSLCAIMLDIDRFKQCNDTYGHAVGDVVLRETAAVLRNTSRSDEPVCRLGGEEFLVLCPQSAIAEAVAAAERLRAAVQGHPVVAGKLHLHVTISIGVAQRTPAMHTPDDLLRCADEAMYAAKAAGRNNVQAALECTVSSPMLG